MRQNITQKKIKPNTGFCFATKKPLPSQLSTNTVYNYVPLEKEIEGHKHKTPFVPPIGLAVLSILKSVYDPGGQKTAENLIVNLSRDIPFFKNVIRRKKVVLIGKGETGGKPIGDALTMAKINYINTHSKTPSDAPFYKEADIIISAVGKKIISPSMLKPGVVLVSVGIRRDGDFWKGDYEEEEVKDIASAYTPTPGGIGPLDIAYLMHNLVKAYKLQLDRAS